MKTISPLLFALFSISFCSGTTPLVSTNSWKTTANYLDPEDDKKLSHIHQKLSKISAYENVKENVCPDNQEKWGVLKHRETGKVFVENDFKILPWHKTVTEANRFDDRPKMKPFVRVLFWDQYDVHHAEMKPFVRCMARCFDLSAMFASAVQQKRFFLIESLVDAGFNVNDDVKEILDPLDLVDAIENGSQNLTRALIRLGAVNAKSFNRITALHWAAVGNKPEVAKILIENGADKGEKDDLGNTALHKAVMWNSAEVIRTLVKKGADTEEKTKRGETALQLAERLAERQNNTEVVKILMETKAEDDQSQSKNIQIF